MGKENSTTPALQQSNTPLPKLTNPSIIKALLNDLGSPIVSTSAIIDGEVLNDPDELNASFSHADAFIDGGWGGIEPSTIIDLSGGEAVVLREGAGPVEFL